MLLNLRRLKTLKHPFSGKHASYCRSPAPANKEEPRQQMHRQLQQTQTEAPDGDMDTNRRI